LGIRSVVGDDSAEEGAARIESDGSNTGGSELRTVPLSAALAVAVFVTLAASTRAATPTPRALVLTRPDVISTFGSGFQALAAQSVSNVQVGSLSTTPGLTTKVYAREGRITGFESAFSRPASRKPGVDYAFSEVDIYKSAAGAEWRLDYSRGHPNTIQAGYKVRLVKLAGFGNDGYYASFSGRPLGSAAPKLYGASITFRHGSYLATIVVSSSTLLAIGGPERLARIVDAKIGRTGR